MVPQWVEGFLSSADVAIVVEAVKGARTRSAVPIVPRVVRRSVDGDFGAGLGVALVAAFLIIVFDPEDSFRSLFWWGPYFNEVAFVGFAALAKALPRNSLFFRLLVPERLLERAVQRRAQLEFYEAGLHGVGENAGVLIMVSLLERRVVVLADALVSERLGSEGLSEIVSELRTAMKKGELGLGLAQAIRSLGLKTAEFLPRIGEVAAVEIQDEFVKA